MREKTKTRPDAGTSEREAEQINTVEAFSVSVRKSITKSIKIQEQLLDCIPDDWKHAVTAQRLAEMLNASERDITQGIQRLRLSGVPVCASTGESHGYYMTDSPEELDRYIKSLKGRNREIRRTVEALEGTRDRMTGQQRIEEF